jgi:predicted aspartyl protease
MSNGFGVAVVSALLAAGSFVIHADVTPVSYAADIQLQAGDLFYSEGHFRESLVAYENALSSDDRQIVRRARTGLIQSALRMAQFATARREAETLAKTEPRNPEVLALYADSLWAAGQFGAAERQYRVALSIAPDSARGHYGIARALLARSQLEQAMNEAQTALRLSPRDYETHHVVGMIYERMHRFEEAAAAFTNFVNLLPNKDTSEKAAWSRAEIRFLKAFGSRTPFAMEPGAERRRYIVPFKTIQGKVVIQAKVNGGSNQDFVVDTGSEKTTITTGTAERARVQPITYTLSAGVGEIGLRGLQLARLDMLQIGDLKLRDVPCMIKNPPLRDLPVSETESLSPLSLGFSMIIDYRQQLLTIGTHLPDEPADFELPLWFYRLATVQGMVDRAHGASFAVDTGGEVISISQTTATSLQKPNTGRRIALQVYGTSGWDRDAFLMPNVDLDFDAIQYRSIPVVVLNLSAPSALLGFDLGGIVGHKFLSKYRVAFDLDRSMLRLRRLS